MLSERVLQQYNHDVKDLDVLKLKQATDYIDTWLNFNFSDSRLPGLQVAILHDENILLTKAFGFANVSKKAKLTPKNTFRIASHSKTFTATAILQLQENNQLRLDDKVSQYTSWFKSSKDERVESITIRQLLNHTSGIIRDGSDANYWGVLRDFPDVVELKKYVTTSTLLYDSDERLKYSNFGYAFLGQVIEAVTGVSYSEYVTKNIVDRLSLKSTSSELNKKGEESLAVGYGLELFNSPRKSFPHIRTNALAPATGFYSTAEDLCRYFASHCFGDTTLLSDASKRSMQHGYWRDENERGGYGLGITEHDKSNWTLKGHSGGFPGFVTDTKFDPKKRLVVSVLCNAMDSPPEKISSSIISIIDTFQQDTKFLKPKVANLKKFTGRFYSKWGPLDIILIGNKLLTVYPRGWNDFEYSEELVPLNQTTLKIEKAGSYSSPGETVTYSFADSGKVEEVRYAGSTIMNWENATAAGWF